MYRHVTALVDGLAVDTRALMWALSIARRADCPIDIVHVEMPSRTRPEHTLRALAIDLNATGITVCSTLLRGRMPDTLIDHLAVADTDLVVMNAHDHGGVEHAVGSVAQAVLRHARGPVLLTTPSNDLPAKKDVPEPPPTVERVFVLLDDSPFGEGILPHAARFASLFHSEVTLVGDGRAILAQAKQHPPAIFAMTAHGRSALISDIAGNISRDVMAMSTTPILTVRPAYL